MSDEKAKTLGQVNRARILLGAAHDTVVRIDNANMERLLNTIDAADTILADLVKTIEAVQGADESGKDRLAKVKQLHARAYEKWTHEEDADLLSLFTTGMPLAQLAAHFQRQPSAIRSRLENVGRKDSHVPRLAAAETDKSLAKRRNAGKVTFNRDRKFDLQLDQALIDERRLAEIFEHANIRRIELKSESHQWEKTGNICIEYRQNGNPSGIAATEADLWVHELKRDGETLCYLMFPAERLKKLAREAYKKGRYRSNAGDGGRFDVVLLRLRDILK